MPAGRGVFPLPAARVSMTQAIHHKRGVDAEVLAMPPHTPPRCGRLIDRGAYRNQDKGDTDLVLIIQKV
jgi:hypothetical protein